MHAALVDRSVLQDLHDLASVAAAIGETGLDYVLATPSREIQRQAFRAQLQVALRHDLPVLIHCRKAFGDLLEIVRGEGARHCGIMHAFSGSVETALECVKMGLHISMCGTLTYRNAVKPLEVAARIPLEHLLLETDAPDLAPEAHRGEVNVPQNLLLTARKLAEVRGMTLEEVAEATTANARRVFRLPP